MKGYASWLPENWRILVLVDRDDDDCSALKARLEQMAAEAGLTTKTQARKGQRFQVVNRMAIEELEAWFLGDWAAVQAAYPRVSATVPQQVGFRHPDAIAAGTWEPIERILMKAGYFSTGLRKLDLARSVARHMDIRRNRSRSFRAFAEAVTAAMV